MTNLCSIGLSLLLAQAALAQAQLTQADPPQKHRAVIRPRLPFSFSSKGLAARQETDRGTSFIIKFREGIEVRLEDSILTPRKDLAAVHQFLKGTEIQRLFTRAVEELDRERADLQARIPADEEPLADLNNYYRVHTHSSAQTEDLINRLNADPLIEAAYPSPVFVPSSIDDIPPMTPSLVSEQGYLGSPPDGYGYWDVHSVVGARFPDGQMAHLEGNWIYGHEDVHHLQVKNLVGLTPAAPWDTGKWTNHGAACVSVMAGDRNSYGVAGFGSATKRVYLVSMTNGAANMISLATSKLNAGDVMCSAVSPWILVTVGGSSVNIQTPLDFLQAEFDATRIASTKGIFYCQSGGNNHIDLDNTFAFGTRYHASSVSSGAFILGATPGVPLTKAAWSVYGQRVDANGWGYNVTSAGYGDRLTLGNDQRQTYTNGFGGTSAASALLAGTIATLVGAVKEQVGRTLSLAEVRTALRSIGTAVPGPDPIGLRPDLEKLLRHFGALDGFRVARQGKTGVDFALEVEGQAGEIWGTLLSNGRGRVPFAANRPILLNPAVLLPLVNGVLPTSGTDTITLPLPNQANLVGLSFYMQTVFFRQGKLYLSNSAELWIQK